MKFIKLSVITFLVVLFCCYGTKAQNCKYDSEKKDPISGVTTKVIYHKLEKSWRIGIALEGRKFSLGFRLILPGDSRYTIALGDTLVLKLQSGEVINVTATIEAPGTPFVVDAGYSSQVLTQYNPVYRITKAQIRKVAESPITAMRFYFGTTPMTVEIKEKNAAKISSSIDCMLNDLPPLEE